MSGYIVRIDRDNSLAIVSRAIAEYTSGNAIPASTQKQEFVFVTSARFTSPVIVLTAQPPGEDLITIENDADQDTNDGLWDTMEADIRSFAETKMGVDDDSNLVSSERDLVKLLNTHIFQLRLDRPNEFLSDGLLAHITTISFTVGDPLDTANKMRNFYREVLRSLHDSVIGERDTFLDTRL